MRWLLITLLLFVCGEQSITHKVKTSNVSHQTYNHIDISEFHPVPRHILIVGDSEACTVQYQVKKVKLSTDVVDVACKGGTVVDYWSKGGNFRQVMHRYSIPELAPDYTLVFLGTNDYWKNTSPDASLMLRSMLAYGSECIWVGPTSVHEKQWPINDLLRNEVTPQCDYFDTESEDIALWDGVHPDAENAEKWLRLVWKTIPLKYEQIR